jgi:hypothetical protein
VLSYAGRPGRLGRCDDVSPGHLASGEMGTMLVVDARFVNEPTRHAAERGGRANLAGAGSRGETAAPAA